MAGMKKVFLLLIVGAAVAVAGYIFLMQYVERVQIRDRIRELAGVLSSGDMAGINTAIDRQFFSKLMDASEDDDGILGREDWKRRWKEDLAVSGYRRFVVGVEMKEKLESGRLRGGRRVETEWHCGVTNEGGDKVWYDMVWFEEDGYWKVARIKELRVQSDAGPPPVEPH